MKIQELVDAAYETADNKGWHDPPPTVAEFIALTHSELSEALEEARDSRALTEVYRTAESPKPEGVPIELADAIIRICDFCGLHKIDLEAAIEAKMEYNRSRPRRHGRAF
jgi:NTP pyrophosphatase (non-canonical NTP hydrolase)